MNRWYNSFDLSCDPRIRSAPDKRAEYYVVHSFRKKTASICDFVLRNFSDGTIAPLWALAIECDGKTWTSSGFICYLADVRSGHLCHPQRTWLFCTDLMVPVRERGREYEANSYLLRIGLLSLSRHGCYLSDGFLFKRLIDAREQIPCRNFFVLCWSCNRSGSLSSTMRGLLTVTSLLDALMRVSPWNRD